MYFCLMPRMTCNRSTSWRAALAVALGVFPSAHAETFIPPSPPLRAILINSRELERAHRNAKLPFFSQESDLNRYLPDFSGRSREAPATTLRPELARDFTYRHYFDQVLKERVRESRSICQRFDAGCLAVAYLDSPEILQDPCKPVDGRWVGPPRSQDEFDRRFEDRYPQDFFLPDRWRSVAIGSQLDLMAYLRLEQEIAAGKSQGAPDYVGSFTEAGYFDPERLAAQDLLAVRAAIRGFQERKLDAGALRSEVMLHPRAFEYLPSLYSSTQGDPRTRDAIADAISSALYLTLDAMIAGADYRRVNYPYLDEERIRSSWFELPAGDLPEIHPITEEYRKKHGGKLLLAGKHGGWMVKGWYGARTNTVHLDLAEPFLENVYVLSHELEHGRVLRSEEFLSQAESIAGKLRSQVPYGDQALRNDLLWLIGRNEIWAFYHQARLFHAVGATFGSTLPPRFSSARGWHDAIYPDARRLFHSREDRERDASFLRMDSPRRCEDVRVREIQRRIEAAKLPDGPKDPGAQSPLEFVEWFGRTYFDARLPRADLERAYQPVAKRSGARHPILTCDGVRRIRDALKDLGWGFGVPFPYRLESRNRRAGDCPDLDPELPGPPGVEGTHPDFAFPSLEAPDALERARGVPWVDPNGGDGAP
jgi:hypothetical protein